MKLMLTSYTAERPQLDADGRPHFSIFYRMPPAFGMPKSTSMREAAKLLTPDYAIFLICDQVIADRASFEVLTTFSSGLLKPMAELLHALRAEGFLELTDYDSNLQKEHPLLEKLVEADLRFPLQWLDVLASSAEIWMHLLSVLRQNLISIDEYSTILAGIASSVAHLSNNAIGPVSAVASIVQEQPDRWPYYREWVEPMLKSYLKYVNGNLLLARSLDAGFLDWVDVSPFYERKFADQGPESRQSQQSISAVHQLFEISFPDYTVPDTKTLMRILHDRRVESLRQLVQDAVDGKVSFDQEFARSVFKEAFRLERRSAQTKKYISYATLPMSLLSLFAKTIPFADIAIGLGLKGAEEMAGKMVDEKLQKDFRWFYMLTDLCKTEEPE